MKKKKNLYIIAFLCFITLVGVTIAYLQSSAIFENIFNAGTYKTVTHEEFVSPTNWTPGDETPKTITTKNEGTIPVRVRVKLEEEWTSKNGDSLDLTYNGENAAIINLDNINDWILKDGYYYYIPELAPGETTSSLIKSVTFNPNVDGDVNCTIENGTVTCESTGNSYDGATYKLKITTETVQAKNYETIWEGVPIMYDYVGDNPCTYNGELVPGAEFVNGQYTYRFRQRHNYTKWQDISDNGWGVYLTDNNSTEPITDSLCSSINNKPIVNTTALFLKAKSVSVDLSSFDTSNVTDMTLMFQESSFDSIDLSTFDVSRVTSMFAMFYKAKMTSLIINNFNSINVTNMYRMFGYVTIDNIEFSKIKTDKATNMSELFSHASINNVDISSWNLENIYYMGFMFYAFQGNLVKIDNPETHLLRNISSMFAESNINTLTIDNLDISNVETMFGMFRNSNIPIIDLSNIDTNDVANMGSMFQNTTATIGYAKTQADADRFNATSNKPSTLTFVVKGS